MSLSMMEVMLDREITGSATSHDHDIGLKASINRYLGISLYFLVYILFINTTLWKHQLPNISGNLVVSRASIHCI